jgi:osmotically-inducible protein OsmY
MSHAKIETLVGFASAHVKSLFKSAAYAAKETTQDVSLTTKVKIALSLSRRIPADQIHVDSQNTIVTLQGEIPSQESRDLAESDQTRCTWGVRGTQSSVRQWPRQ